MGNDRPVNDQNEVFVYDNGSRLGYGVRHFGRFVGVLTLSSRQIDTRYFSISVRYVHSMTI